MWALSCWNVQLSPYNSPAQFIRSFFNKCSYAFAFIFLGAKHSFDFPHAPNAAHIILVSRGCRISASSKLKLLFNTKCNISELFSSKFIFTGKCNTRVFKALEQPSFGKFVFISKTYIVFKALLHTLVRYNQPACFLQLSTKVWTELFLKIY